MPTDRHLANAIRTLAMDAVQAANSGHPGMPMGMADIAEVLWRQFLQHNPANPQWPNRDRFVLSNGHGAMLIYSLLHLTGYALSIEDIKQFRQLHSKTPGHPEFGHTPGIETTTGPLGQGLANGVGMALAERLLANHFNRDDYTIIDHYTYVFAGDGCLMEGISHEACSLAGTLGLSKLIVFWDDNGISIDGDVSGWFTDNTAMRFHAYNWHVIEQIDGHDSKAIYDAIVKAQAEKDRPTLICCKTQIGYGSPNRAGDCEAHGAPLGEEEIALTRKNLNWPYPPFTIPNEIYTAWDARLQGSQREQQWQDIFTAYQQAYPELANEFTRRIQGKLPLDWENLAQTFIEQTQTQQNQVQIKPMATRKASQECLNAFAPLLPELIGGSADLTGSNCTAWKQSKIISNDDCSGNYIEYGVREFAMAAMMNGMALHGGFIPYGGTFLVFSDYARNAIRLSALMKQRVIYVLSHDSIGLGEDGPTHQPIEHAAILRMTPDLRVWRPCDFTETAVAWKLAISHQGPSCLLLTRQNVPLISRNQSVMAHIAQGGYVLRDGEDGILMTTGSEIGLALAAADILLEQNIHIRVVSMPCCEIFKQQSSAYREQVLPKHIKPRLAIEAGVADYWYQFVGDHGDVIGLNHFGHSAPATEVFAVMGLTVPHIVESMLTLLKVNKYTNSSPIEKGSH